MLYAVYESFVDILDYDELLCVFTSEVVNPVFRLYALFHLPPVASDLHYVKLVNLIEPLFVVILCPNFLWLVVTWFLNLFTFYYSHVIIDYKFLDEAC